MPIGRTEGRAYTRSMAQVHAAEEKAERLRSKAERLSTESLRVLSATLRMDEDANGERAAFIELVLPDPPSGEDTWPLDEVLDLHEQIDGVARSLEVPIPWHVTLRQETVEEPDPEDLDPSED